jgi:hypothetical protein
MGISPESTKIPGGKEGIRILGIKIVIPLNFSFFRNLLIKIGLKRRR